MKFSKLILLLFSYSYAHISMSYPPSRRNKLSPYYLNSGNVDYNIRAPLNNPPYKFPCKGFPTGPPTASYIGNTISVTLEGSATHGGGHCQFGISYDDTNFLVLKTVLNTCLLDSMTYTFNLPSNAPGGNAIVFWTWINRIGHREYYMECADTLVNNGNSPTSSSQLQGTELLVVNLPGYQEVPEWNLGDPSSVDGRDLLAQRKNILLTVNGQTVSQQQTTVSQQTQQQTTVSQQTQQTQQQTTVSKQQTTVPPQQDLDDLCIDGDMSCYNTGFNTCANGILIYRDCALGTVCKSSGNYIVCDYP